MSKARIMIVEDEELVRLAIQTYLESVGFEVPLAVASGEEAISRLSRIEPDLVLMDVRLSGRLDGLKTAAIIKETFPVPVIFLTAYSDAETLKAAKTTDPYGYILKPFDERSLSATIEMVLHKARIHKEISNTKESLSTILSSVGEGIIVTGINGIVEFVNPPAKRLLGIPDEAPPLTSIFKIMKLSDSDSGKALSLRFEDVVMAGKRVDIADCAIGGSSGEKASGHLRIEPHRDEKGGIRGAVFSFRDETERDKLKSSLEKQLRLGTVFGERAHPKDSVINGYRVSCFALSSSFGAGSAFGFFPINEERLALYVTDIMGYGVRTAAAAFLLDMLLSPEGKEGNRFSFLDVDCESPSRVVARLNTLFAAGRDRTFFTMSYGVLDSAKDKFKMVRAGHTYPLIRHASGEVDEIRSDGFAIGIAGGAPAQEIDFRIEPGSEVFLYTDGIIDCRNSAGERFSKERLIDILRSTSGRDLQATLGKIKESVLSYNEGIGLDDDAVCIAFGKLR